MNKSPIEWTDWTSNPIFATSKEGKRGWFCEKVSPGCAHCYAATLNSDRGIITGTGHDFLPVNRDKVDFHLNERELLEWSKPRYAGQRCFAFDMTDVFGEWVSDEWLDKCFAAMALAPHVTFQILTKRPERMRAYVTARARDVVLDGRVTPRPASTATYVLWAAQNFCDSGFDYKGEYPSGNTMLWPLPNIWLGVTVENQRWADERIPILMQTPAAVRFLSCEPMLGAIDLTRINLGKRDGQLGDFNQYLDAIHGRHCDGMGFERNLKKGLDWVIVGGESGPKHRPFDLAWARSIVAQCEDAGVACFVKQLGGARPGNRLEDLPEDLRVREFPT
jgi:protein gp37